MIVSFITAFIFGTFSVFGGRLIYNNTCKDLNDDEENNENQNNENNNSHELNDNESILTLQNVMDSLRIKLSNNLLYTIKEKNENSDDEKDEDKDGYHGDIDDDVLDVDDDVQTEEEDTEEETEINDKKTLFYFPRIPFFS